MRAKAGKQGSAEAAKWEAKEPARAQDHPLSRLSFLRLVLAAFTRVHPRRAPAQWNDAAMSTFAAFTAPFWNLDVRASFLMSRS